MAKILPWGGHWGLQLLKGVLRGPLENVLEVDESHLRSNRRIHAGQLEVDSVEGKTYRTTRKGNGIQGYPEKTLHPEKAILPCIEDQ